MIEHSRIPPSRIGRGESYGLTWTAGRLRAAADTGQCEVRGNIGAGKTRSDQIIAEFVLNFLQTSVGISSCMVDPLARDHVATRFRDRVL